MPRQIRNTGKTGWAHIIIRGINRENLFYDEEDYLRFVSTLTRFQRETGSELAAWCLMSNHVHLLMFVEDGSHAVMIKKLLVSYAAYYNKKYDRVGHVFQDRFRSEAINDEGYLLTVARYIYRNPQKAGICPARTYPYTYIQTDGILSGYFAAPEALFAYLETENADRCMEYDSSGAYSDSEALELLCEMNGSRNPQSVQSLEKAKRDELLRRLKEKGLTVRQISRLTGVNRNTVQRA